MTVAPQPQSASSAPYGFTEMGFPSWQVHCRGPNTIGPFSDREYCLAAFLVVASEYSYFGMGGGWSVSSFPWYPEYDRPLGKPLGRATSSGAGRYFRAYEQLNVTLDTSQNRAAITWHKLGPVPGPPPPPPTPPPPPVQPIGPYTGLQQWAIHQNPPSFNETKSIGCTNQTFNGCVREASVACDTTAGCTSFCVISPSYNGRVWAELGPLPLGQGEPNKWWSSWQKSSPTAGTWKPCPGGRCDI